MALFAKNKPTKRIEFEGGWVELQYLSKGVKDDIQKSILEALKGVDIKQLDQISDKDKELPKELPVDMVNKITDTDYVAVYNSIKSWSESEPITIDSVRELDDEIFEKILKEVKKMNKLELEERKN